jgi:hypothetical protein
MMYISAIPIAVSIRSTRIDLHADERIRFQMRHLLLRDTAFLFISWFILCLGERDHLRDDPGNYSAFKIFFETCSAFGTVGLSLGFSGELTSFSGMFHRFSKFVLCVVMLFGRHRGLPHAIDPAVQPNRRPSLALREEALPMSALKDHQLESAFESLAVPPPAEKPTEAKDPNSLKSLPTTADTVTPADHSNHTGNGCADSASDSSSSSDPPTEDVYRKKKKPQELELCFGL